MDKKYIFSIGTKLRIKLLYCCLIIVSFLGSAHRSWAQQDSLRLGLYQLGERSVADYEEQNNSGIENKALNDLNISAAQLKQIVTAAGIPNFKVFDYTAYSLIGRFKEPEKWNEWAFNTMDSLIQHGAAPKYGYQHYLLVGKEIDPSNGKVKYRVKLRLPTVASGNRPSGDRSNNDCNFLNKLEEEDLKQLSRDIEKIYDTKKTIEHSNSENIDKIDNAALKEVILLTDAIAKRCFAWRNFYIMPSGDLIYIKNIVAPSTISTSYNRFLTGWKESEKVSYDAEVDEANKKFKGYRKIEDGKKTDMYFEEDVLPCQSCNDITVQYIEWLSSCAVNVYQKKSSFTINRPLLSKNGNSLPFNETFINEVKAFTFTSQETKGINVATKSCSQLESETATFIFQLLAQRLASTDEILRQKAIELANNISNVSYINDIVKKENNEFQFVKDKNGQLILDLFFFYEKSIYTTIVGANSQLITDAKISEAQQRLTLMTENVKKFLTAFTAQNYSDVFENGKKIGNGVIILSSFFDVIATNDRLWYIDQINNDTETSSNAVSGGQEKDYSFPKLEILDKIFTISPDYPQTRQNFFNGAKDKFLKLRQNLLLTSVNETTIYSNIVLKMYELWLESSYVTSLQDYENDVVNKKKVILYFHKWNDVTNIQTESLDIANNQVELKGTHWGFRQKHINGVPQYILDAQGNRNPQMEFYTNNTYNFNDHPFELVELRAMDDAFDIEGIKIKKGDSRWLPAVMVYDLMNKQTQNVYSQTAWFALELVGYWFGISETYRGLKLGNAALKLAKKAETVAENTIVKQLAGQALKTSATGLIDLGMTIPGTYINFFADQTWIDQHASFVNAYRAVSFAYFTGRMLYSLAKVDKLKQEADNLAEHGVTAEEKAFGQEISNFCKGTSCFTPNTPILTADLITFKPIKDIKIGDQVATNAKVTSGHAAGLGNSQKVAYLALDSEVNPDPYTSADQKALDKLDYSIIEMQTVTLSMPKGNGTISTIQLLRPTTWLEAQGIAVIGKSTYLHLPEMGLEGFATVTDLAHFRVTKSDTASDEEWSSGLVTGIFKHIANGVYHLRYDNGDSLGVTGTHPLYSLDRQQFVPTEDIKVGEQLLAKSGIITVVSKTYDATPQEVYNLEVGQWHNFLVGVSGVVAHNTGCERVLKYIAEDGKYFEQHLSHERFLGVFDLETNEINLLKGLKNSTQFDKNIAQIDVIGLDLKNNKLIAISGEGKLNNPNLSDEILDVPYNAMRQKYQSISCDKLGNENTAYAFSRYADSEKKLIEELDIQIVNRYGLNTHNIDFTIILKSEKFPCKSCSKLLFEQFLNKYPKAKLIIQTVGK